MITLASLFVFIFGTIVGSFLNVVILRYNTGKNIFGPTERSMCFSCGKQLEWSELVPVLSFVALGGKCSVCKSKISWQYPLVEIATGLIFLGLFWQNVVDGVSGTLTAIFGLVWCLLIVIAVYDLRHKIIPDFLVYGFAGLAFLAALIAQIATLTVGGLPAGAGATARGLFAGLFLSDTSLLGSPLSSAIFAGLTFFAFFAALWIMSDGRWLGFGDAKLVLGVGFLLGLSRGLSALTLAFWIGAAFSLALLGLKTVLPAGLRARAANMTMKSEIPFAPFIILGTLISFFWSFDFFGLSSLL